MSTQSYFTTASPTEAPIVQDKGWALGLREGGSWNDVNALTGTPNIFYAAAFVGASGADDCIAVRQEAYHRDHESEATVFRASGYTATDSHEIELLARFRISNGLARGYELDYGIDTNSFVIVKWLGALASFTVLSSLGPSDTSQMPLASGAKVRFRAEGPLLSAYVNDVLTETALDINAGGIPPWMDGAPGMGFFVRPAAGQDPQKFCWSDWRSRGLRPISPRDYTYFPKPRLRLAA